MPKHPSGRRKAVGTAKAKKPSVKPSQPRKQSVPKGNIVRGKRVNRTPKPLQAAHRGESEKAAVNRIRAFELRMQRKSYREIAAALGVCVKTAFDYVEQYWGEVDSITTEKAEMLISMELGVLDQMQARWLPLALHADLDVSKVVKGKGGPAHINMDAYDAGMKAVERVLKIQERRARLLGLDAAMRVEHSGEIRHKHMTLEEMESRMRDAEA